MPERNLDLPRSPREMSTAFLPSALAGSLTYEYDAVGGSAAIPLPRLLNHLIPCLIPVFLRASPEFESGAYFLDSCGFSCLHQFAAFLIFSAEQASARMLCLVVIPKEAAASKLENAI